MSDHHAGRDPNRPTRAELLGTSDERETTPLPRWVLPVIMITTLTIGGWFIVQNLAATSKTEDCQMSGRRNCVPPIDTSNMGK